MEGSVAQVTTPIAVLDRLVEQGHADLIEVARRAFAEWTNAAGISHRRNHINADVMTYHRGRWHMAVTMLALLAGMDVATEESDLLEFAHVLSAYSPEEKE